MHTIFSKIGIFKNAVMEYFKVLKEQKNSERGQIYIQVISDIENSKSIKFPVFVQFFASWEGGGRIRLLLVASRVGPDLFFAGYRISGRITSLARFR